MGKRYRHIINREFAALTLLSVVLCFSLVKNFHEDGPECVHITTEETSFIPHTEECAICSYWLSSYESNRIEVYWFFSIITAFILIMPVRKTEGELPLCRSLRAPPAF